MRHYFVTGTGTGIGKTYISAGIIRAARQAGRSLSAIKPIVSGFTTEDAAASDPAMLLNAMQVPVTQRNIAACAPWRFVAPLSPDMAAAAEARRIDFKAVTDFCHGAMAAATDSMLIEGVGGAAVPLDERHVNVDIAAALNIPALLVAGTYLGTISHTISTVVYLSSRGVKLTAIVLSESEDAPMTPQDTALVIQRHVQEPVYIIPRISNDQSFGALARAL